MPRASRTGSTTSASAGRAGAVTCPPIVPYTGYGSTEWVRVLCRVLLSRPIAADEPSKRRRKRSEQGIRGWRSFTSVPVGDVPVVIEVGGERLEVLADRGGVVDTRVPVALAPGWHRSDAAHRGVGAGRGADLDRRHRRRLRHHLRRRRHRDGDRAPPAVRRVLEHVRARRARAHPHPRHGGALRAPRPRPPRLAGDLPLHRRLERRADAHALPLAQPLPARVRCSSPTGGPRTTAGSAAGASTRRRTCAGSPTSSRTCAGS